VTVVDADDLQFSSMAQVDGDAPVCMLGLQIHILTAGATYNLDTRRASAAALLTSKE
jgi:cyanophycinase